MTDDDRRVQAYGDSGVLVTFLHDDSGSRWAAAQRLQRRLLGLPTTDGVVDVVASFDSAFVTFDPVTTTFELVCELVFSNASVSAQPRERSPRTFWLPVMYGGEHGPDLDDVAHEAGVSTSDVIEQHSGASWTVRVVGSPAGAPLMDSAQALGSVSRASSPRSQVAPGSVGLSGRQCIVYPATSPAGWRLIGRTPVRLFDVGSPDLVPYRPGDLIRFCPIPGEDQNRWQGSLAEYADALEHEFGS